MSEKRNRTDADTLVAIQRAEFEKAAGYDRWQFWLQILAACMAASTLFAKGDALATLLSVGTIGCVTGAAFLVHMSRAHRDLGEKARRATYLVGGLGIQLSDEEMRDLMALSSIAPENLEKWYDLDFFATREKIGPLRATEMLGESAFWSVNLLKASASVMWRRVISFGILVVLAFLLALGWLSEVGRHEMRIFCTLASSFVLFEAVLRVRSYQDGARDVDNVLQRLGRLADNGYPLHDFFLIAQDYNSAVERSPMMVKRIHDKRADHLNQLWKDYLKRREERKKARKDKE